MHEFQIIKNYFTKLSRNNKSALNLNDDVFFDQNKEIVISIDTYNLGTHFINFKYPELVIKKILRSSLSDLICKGVNPKYYFISGSGNKKTFTKNNLNKISKALQEEQQKYGISLCGGDTTFSNKLSFTIISLGYAKKIIYRNKAKLNDDIYISGDLGDSFLGLQILKKKIKVNKLFSKYFIKKYYHPDLQLKLSNCLNKFANTSIDVSDGLFNDLKKLLNKQKISFKLFENKIPISRKLNSLIKQRNLNKIDLISNGDDYQILFTADTKKARIIEKICLDNRVKISKIGKITSGKNQSMIINKKGQQIVPKNSGYVHQF